MKKLIFACALLLPTLSHASITDLANKKIKCGKLVIQFGGLGDNVMVGSTSVTPRWSNGRFPTEVELGDIFVEVEGSGYALDDGTPCKVQR